MEFVAFPKIPRLKREITITEKIDGTNAQVVIGEDGSIRAGSRTRWITPQDDNYGFAKWVSESRDQLMELGPGQHFGEWYGAGIQRRYGMESKRFALFNVGRWNAENVPACCDVVPVLYQGRYSDEAVEEALAKLRSFGSVAAPGFMRAEGIIVYHSAARSLFKVLLENDEIPKGVSQAA
jgi:hypothetical protein